MALDQIGLVISKTAAGELDLDSMKALLEGLRTYIVGLAGSEFENRLKQYEALVYRRDENEPAATNGHAPSNEAQAQAPETST
jgi:hypothetical protein